VTPPVAQCRDRNKIGFGTSIAHMKSDAFLNRQILDISKAPLAPIQKKIGIHHVR
jgi:hypothetical protein